MNIIFIPADKLGRNDEILYETISLYETPNLKKQAVYKA